jgi:hypothetical protein
MMKMLFILISASPLELLYVWWCIC